MKPSSFFRGLFGSSRYVVGLAVIGTFVGSVLLLVMGALTVFRVAIDEFQLIRTSYFETEITADDVRNAEDVYSRDPLTGRNVEHVGVQFIQITDIILLGTVLYIVSLGVYQLFVDPKIKTTLPAWLHVGDLGDLKRDLLSVTVVLLGVTFLGEVVEWRGDDDILALGGAVALVVAALGLIIWLSPKKEDVEEHREKAARSSERQ
jgi:uncharacterized membrane protein YqhA